MDKLLIYLDVCCLNRPFDDQTQPRVRLESEAILLILGRIESGDWSWVGSEVMHLEVARTPDPERRLRVSTLMERIDLVVPSSDPIISRGVELESMGFHAFDALHLACSESAPVDVFLTTDDRLLRLARRVAADLSIRVENPLIWLSEVIG